MNEGAQFIMGKCEKQMDEDSANTHIRPIDDREVTCMGCIGETEPYQSTIIA